MLSALIIRTSYNSIATSSRKTRKSMCSRLVQTSVMMEVRKFVNRFDSESERLFGDKFSHKR